MVYTFYVQLRQCDSGVYVFVYSSGSVIVVYVFFVCSSCSMMVVCMCFCVQLRQCYSSVYLFVYSSGSVIVVYKLTVIVINGTTDADVGDAIKEFLNRKDDDGEPLNVFIQVDENSISFPGMS